MSFVRSLVLLSAVAALACAAVSQKQLDTAFNTIDQLKQQLTNAQTQLDSIKARQHQSDQDIDTLWILMNFIVMLFMIPATALREIGVSRTSDTQLFVVKYVLLLTASAVAFWIVGYGAIFGDTPNANQNAFIGNTDYILVSSGTGRSSPKYAIFSYEWTKAAISTAVLFSVFGERVSAIGYFFITLVYTSFIYPVGAHWVWGPTGWISPFNNGKEVGRAGNQGALDYSGSCVVHIAGGAGALAGLIYVGARKSPKNSFSNLTLVLIGTLAYWFSFYGFTAGQTLGLTAGAGIDSVSNTAGKICWTVTLAASGGAIGALILSRVFAPSEGFNTYHVFNGILSGLVAVASGAGLYDEYAGFLIGLVAGILYVVLGAVFDNIFDDGLRVVTVHLVSGWLGMAATGLWARELDVLRAYPNIAAWNKHPEKLRFGIFYGGGAQLFGLNLLASVAITAWSFIMVLLTLVVLDKFGALRLSATALERGADYEPAISQEGQLLEEASHEPTKEV